MTIRIGIVGVDSSHADVYSGHLNGGDVPGAQAAVIYGDDPQAAQALATKHQIPHVAKTLDEVKGLCDAVMVPSRWGEDHLRLARPFLQAGMAVFVDKPLADTEEDAQAILDLARRHGAKLMAGTSLRYGRELAELKEKAPSLGAIRQVLVSGPAYSHLADPRARKLTFYGTHCTELLVAMTGRDGRFTHIRRSDREYLAVWEAPGRPLGILQLLNLDRLYFSVTVFGTDGYATCQIADSNAYYTNLLKGFVQMVRTGQPPAPPEEAFVAVQMVLQLERA